MADKIKSKYYFAHNAGGRLIAGEKFEITEIRAGSSMGVYEATTPEKQAELDKIVLTKSNAVEEISESDYEDNRKKKALELNNWQHSNLQSTSLQTALNPVAGLVVEGKQAGDPTEADVLATEDGAKSNLVKMPPAAVSEDLSPPKKTRK